MLTPPSPSISPSLTAQDTIISRKRQRSESMQSEGSSSSPKRSLSEDPAEDTFRSPPQSEDMTALNLSEANINDDIDSYMAEQDRSGATEPLTTPRSAATTILSPSEKLRLIQSLCNEPMKIGETWYIVSRRWYRRWEKACSGQVDKEGAVEEKDIGPVDNTPLVDLNGNLVAQAVEHVDVEFLSEEAFTRLVEWYVLQAL